MCGICGFNWRDEKLCRAMALVLRHRGPDDEGYYFDDGVSLGHRRLSIIDLEHGHQPMHNEDKSVWIIHNGEIYNFKDIRGELEKRHVFRTNSDTEVIIHAYEELGPECVKKFNGIWAFCIYDKRRGILFLSRDRFGVKPLYYYSDSGRFVFASEIKALLEYVTAQPNDEIIYDFLVKGMVEHKEDTFFKGIKRVPPSTNLVFDLETGHIEKVRYWDIIFINKETRSSSKEDEDYAKKFYSLFESSVRMQLMSEVPVGTCLSGGLDSSSIVLLISRVILDSIGNGELPNTIGERLKTFSAVYDDEKVDEREYIEEVVRNTGVEKNYVFPSGGQLFKELEKLTYYQDEPFFSTSPYAQWNVMKLASRKVKVLLDGQGADELLAGYIPFFRVYLNQLYKEKKILTYIKELLLSLDLTIRHLLSSSMISTIIKYIWYRKIKRKASLSLIREFLNEDFLKENEKGSIKGSNLINNLADLSYMHLMNGSLQNLLRYEDRNSMAFSIEARVPFLDHRIVEYVFSLPLTQRIKNGWTKYILRNAMKGLLPEKVRKRRGKIGFATPEEKWLKENREEIIKIFNSPAFKERKYFNKDVIIKKFEEFCMGKKYDTTLFWKIISLEIWFRVFIDKASNKRNQKVN